MRLRDYLAHQADGSWEVVRTLTLKSTTAYLRLSPGTRLTRGVKFLGYDVALLCEQDAVL